MKKNLCLHTLGLLVACAIVSSLAQAQVQLLPGAFRQLQQLVVPDHDHTTVDPSSESSKLTLEQLKEEARQLEAQWVSLKNEENEFAKQPVPNYNRLKVNELEPLLTSLQISQEQWFFKKELSEKASVQLSRERLKLQSALQKLERNDNTDYDHPDNQEQLQQELHNLSLKMRFAEQFQVLAGERLETIESYRQQAQSIYEQRQANTATTNTHQPERSHVPFDLPHLNELKQRLSQTRKDLIQLQNFYFEVKYQLEQIHSVELLYKIMLHQKQRLQSIPAELSARQLQQDLKLKRYLLLEEKATLANNERQGEKRQEISHFLDQVEQLIRVASELHLLESELYDRQQRMILLLDQRLLWMPTAPALSPESFITLVANIYQQLPILMASGYANMPAPGWLLIVLLPLLVLYYWLGKTQALWLQSVETSAELRWFDWLKRITILLFRPLPIMGVVAFYLNIYNPQPLTQGILVLTYGWGILLDAVKNNGFVQKCLNPPDTGLPLKPVLAVPSLIALWLVDLTMLWYENPFENRLAQLVLIVCSAWQLAIVWQWHNRFAVSDWRGVALRVTGFCLLSLITIAAMLGYIQLSWLAFCQLQTLIVYGGLLWLLYLLADQGFKIKASRLAVQQAIELKQDTKTPHSSRDALKISRKKVQELENQGRIMLSLIFTTLTVLLLIYSWRSASPLLTSLSETSLLSFSGGQTALSIAFGSVINFVIILAATWLLAQNLSGLLQMVLPASVIRHDSTSYIINKIMSYLIWIAGGILALGQMGLPWEKLQWIVLAISVGAGLGLQDVVANFVSGLIILIERPIRVGDTITINNIEGIVRQIRARATIIEVVDRKEFIVPNKALTTGQLTNWSLSSSILRIQLWYGVEHGADNNLVLMILLQAAENSPLVLKTPASEAAFIECTEHSDRYELRIFVDVDDRFHVKNQVNQRVKELFREHGVEVAHWQHDINILPMSEELIPKKGATGE